MSSILTNHEGEIFVPTLLNLNSFSAQSPYPDILLQCPTIDLLTIFVLRIWSFCSGTIFQASFVTYAYTYFRVFNRSTDGLLARGIKPLCLVYVHLRWIWKVSTITISAWTMLLCCVRWQYGHQVIMVTVCNALLAFINNQGDVNVNERFETGTQTESIFSIHKILWNLVFVVDLIRFADTNRV